MENQISSKQDCGCGEGCCTPKKNKRSLWKRIIFLAIIILAGVIVTVKLVSAHNASAKKCCETTECCETTKSSPCCQ